MTWTNVNLSAVSSSNIHLLAISQELLQPFSNKISFSITHLDFHSNLPDDNELQGVPAIYRSSTINGKVGQLATYE